MQIDIWSDVMCPWCAIGKAHLEAALADFPGREAVDVRWHSFELDPHAPREVEGDQAERLAKKYGVSRARAEAMIEHVRQAGAQAGLAFRFDRARPGNTFDAHRLLHLAGERGRQGAMKARLLSAYMVEGEAVGRPEVLQRLAEDVGLDAGEVAAVLASDAFADAVRADERQAAELGIRGVPFFVLDGRLGLSGAQPVEVFAQALRRAWPDAAAGAACDADGCALPAGDDAAGGRGG